MKKQAAIVFTPISQEEMALFITRAFRALTPRSGFKNGEIYYDLTVEEGQPVVIRVYTSISPSGMSASRGADAIRVGLFSTSGRPLKAGKLPIVKRTQNWRDNLRRLIEDEIEDYHDKEDYWNSRA